MSRFARAALLAALVALALAGPAPAFGGWGRATSSYASYPAYYSPVVYPTTVSYYAPVWEVSYAAPVVCPPATTVLAPVASVHAVPTPAPPSQTAEPPVRSGPVVTESRAGEGPSVMVRSGPGNNRARVGFWNVTGRDLTLTVDGQTYVLSRGRSLTLNLGRQFVWRVDQRPAQAEAVPAGNGTLEIVVRQ
jgi:hypothetical protein